MDVHERLSLEAVSADTLIAAEHRHRYELTARAAAGRRVLDLCCGVGYGSAILAAAAESVVAVDRDAAATDAGRAAAIRSGIENVEFVTADALRFLRSVEAGRFDLVVCFEGLEHLPQVELVADELGRLVEGGAALLASVPNSGTFGEENDFHLTDFDPAGARALADRIPGATLAFQTHAEGSVIRSAETDVVDARVRLTGEQDLDWANHFLILAGLDAGELLGVGDAALHLAVAPVNHRYMRGLERANRDLQATNMRLTRERLGRFRAAAADRADDHGDGAASGERIAWLEHELAEARRERDEHRRAWVVVRHSRLTRLAARLSGHRFD